MAESQALAGVACRRRQKKYESPQSTPVAAAQPHASGPSSCGRPPVQSVRRPLRHLVACGSTNKYRPVNRSKASGNTAKRPTLEVYFPCTTATMLTMTATVKAIDSQRWVCRTHLFQFDDIVAILLDSRLSSRLRRPVGRFNTELLGVLRCQPPNFIASPPTMRPMGVPLRR